MANRSCRHAPPNGPTHLCADASSVATGSRHGAGSAICCSCRTVGVRLRSWGVGQVFQPDVRLENLTYEILPTTGSVWRGQSTAMPQKPAGNDSSPFPHPYLEHLCLQTMLTAKSKSKITRAALEEQIRVSSVAQKRWHVPELAKGVAFDPPRPSFLRDVPRNGPTRLCADASPDQPFAARQHGQQCETFRLRSARGICCPRAALS